MPLFLGRGRKKHYSQKDGHCDKSGQYRTREKTDHYNNIDIWKKNLKEGSTAILMVNRSLDKSMKYALNFEPAATKPVKSDYDIVDDIEMNNTG